jgi:S1-C subfamily serine protease
MNVESPMHTSNSLAPTQSVTLRKAFASAFAVLALVALLFSPCAPARAQFVLLSPENRHDLELQPGVVLIVVRYKATLDKWTVNPGILGTGFLYRPDGYVITNGHVAQFANEKDPRAIQDRFDAAKPQIFREILSDVQKTAGRELKPEEIDSIKDQVIKAINAGNLKIESMTLTVLLANGASYLGEIKAYSDPIDEGGKDIAIIKIDGKNLPTVALGNSDEVNVGDPLTVIGYPGEATNAAISGLFSDKSLLVPTVTNGRVSAVNKTDYKGTPVIQSEAVINHGNSGGPAFGANGQAVAVATYTLNKADGAVQGLNFFVPINTAMEFVRQAGAQPERGSFDQAWSDALEAYADHHWYKSHELLGSVLEMMPNEPDALRLQQEAAANIHNESPVAYWLDRLGKGPVIAVAAILVLLVAGFLFLVTRKPAATKSRATVALHTQPQTPLPAPAPVPAIQAPAEKFGSLYINNGPLSGNRFEIPQKGLLIGRDPSVCSVVLPDDTISKEHAWVVPLDNGIAVIDRSSVNGTYVNSSDSPRISKMILKNGDRIIIGRKDATEITYFSA